MSTSSTAQEPPLVTEYPCGQVRPLDGEVFWEATPSDMLLVPVNYTAWMSPGPRAQDVLAQLIIEVEDETGARTQGAVTDVQQSSGWLLSWTPEVPLVPGQYTGYMRGGEFPEPIECGPESNFGGIEYTQYSFQFTVEDAWQEWVNGAELTLSPAAGGGVTTGCCRTSDCEGDDCVQCWDQWGQRGIHAEWTGTGIAYLDKQVRPITDNLQGSTLAAFGEYCVEGTVSASGVEPRTIEACGILTEDEYLEMLDAIESPREECRTLVRATTCQSLPEGMTELSTLFVVYGSNEEDARAALAAAPYHPLEGCLSAEPPSQPSTPGDAGTVATPPDGGSIVPGPDARPSDGGTSPNITTPDARASEVDAGPKASDAAMVFPIHGRDPSSDCNCTIGRRADALFPWSLLGMVAAFAAWRRRRWCPVS